MSRIYVRTLPGRVARESRNGEFIPSDRFVPVSPSAYIDRLLNVHGDIEVQPEKEVQKDTPKPKPDKPAGEEKKTS